METLDGTEWDVTIYGTDFTSSLLALSLSRSGKRILHLDKNDYYGDAEAALSLSEAEAWASRWSGAETHSRFSHAGVFTSHHDDDVEGQTLASSRAYSLALAPHLVYARSNLVPALVSSRSHNQLDFQAVGSWFVVNASPVDPESVSRVTRVPSGREDVFQDGSLDLKAKRSLMKFLRFVANSEEQTDIWQDSQDLPFSAFLEDKFGLPKTSHGPILALTMSQTSPDSTTTGFALPKVARHLRSIGVFGPGFGAVLPKWGGLAEIAQVACRACAVGGGVYVLNTSISSIVERSQGQAVRLQLSGGEKVSTTWLCGSSLHELMPPSESNIELAEENAISRSVSVVSSPLPSLFPLTSEGGVTPAGAVVFGSTSEGEPPVHLFVHTSDAGECPMNQSVVYATTALPADSGFPLLEKAVSNLLAAINEESAPKILWTLRYQQRGPLTDQSEVTVKDGIVTMPPLSQDLAVEDSVLENVKMAWQTITGESEETFMNFEAREGVGDEDDG